MTTSATPELDAACLTAHGGGDDAASRGLLVAVFAGQVAHELLLIGARLGYSIALIDPLADKVQSASNAIPGLTGATAVDQVDTIDENTDVVMTDHHRDELGPLLSDLLATDARWIGLMGNPRHEGPHVEALRRLGHDDAEIARIHRPIGLNIGSRTPAEIAVATLAGLLADRAGRPGGFHF
jgi:xanthine/CO dehydrogenase XdhC/CoxF family maturation factor